MTEDQIRLYALARVTLPVDVRIRSYAPPFEPWRFPTWGLELSWEDLPTWRTWHLWIEHRTLSLCPERTICRMIWDWWFRAYRRGARK